MMHGHTFLCGMGLKCDGCVIQAVPGLNPLGIQLLDAMLRYDPQQRVSSKAALAHPYFNDINMLLNE
jgi:serine/threonine protein kinase